MIKRIFLLSACAGLVACSQGKKADDRYDVSMPLKQVMGHVIDPAAWALWDNSGEVLDATGVHSRVPVAPETIPDVPGQADDVRRIALEEQWARTENGTTQLILATNLLRLPGYVRIVERDDNGDWLKFTQQLNEFAHAAQEAVEAKDGQAMFDTGGKIYEVCTTCHEKYLLPFLDPTTGEAPKGLTPAGEPIRNKN